MKNLFISLFLFLLTVLMIHIELLNLEKICNDQYDTLDIIEIHLENEEYKESYDKIMSLLDKWEKYSKTSSIFYNHIEIDCITSDFFKATQFIKYEDKVNSLALVHSLKFNVRAMLELQSVSLSNIL